MVKRENLVDYKSNCFENEKHQTQVSLLIELVSDAYLTSTQQIRLKAAITSSRICSTRRIS